MTRRSRIVIALVLAGCGDEGMADPPPVSSSSNGTLPVTSAGTGTDTDTDTEGTASGSGPVTSSESGSGSETAGQPFTVITGGFVDGGATVRLPITCRVTFYEPGQIEPSTGETQGGFLFQLGGFTIDMFPQNFEIESTEVPMVEEGVEGYIVAQCAADDDGLFDDGLIGYYPALPLQRVTVPASNVFIPIQSM
jgi:hypothetical protein